MWVCAAALAGCYCSGLAQQAGYDQAFRPQVHFSPQRNWTNDPNGLVYFRGRYHLFFQYNPEGDEWGHMSWGHAVSPDLLHWRQLAVAIPEEGATMIFTGSVAVDESNTSGLCAARTTCLVAIYTGHTQTGKSIRQTQNLAYSRDNGTTWTKYAQNPVLDLHRSDFRDPSVSWDSAAHHWLMAVSLPDEHKVSLYASTNLKAWTHLSDFGGEVGDRAGAWECPDLLRVPSVDGKTSMWALKVGLNPGAPQGGSGEQYFLGDFDGTRFTASTEPGAYGWTNYGEDDYCAISFNGLPRGERPVLLGWMNNWQYAAKTPTSPWRGQMSLPRRLSFMHDAEGLALRQEPVVAPLRGTAIPIAQLLKDGPSTYARIPLNAPYELDLDFGNEAHGNFGVRLYSDDEHWTEVGFDRAKKEFYIDRMHSGLQVSPEFLSRTVAPLAESRRMELRLIVDRSSVEAWAQDGTIAMTDLIYPPGERATLHTFSSEGTVAVKGQAWELRSIWK